ncbi:MAG: cytochrome C biogenesis protein [Methanobrevibacter sp.]|uniref:cytochrome c biogenesis CcdA family protein n=1 Tax=Methanobrevibacter sp. TaxID=66852 RepID=UPI0025F31B78|nr:cytochrome c biogenesis protein CcdA [Methanobrevibacter sp.]MBR0270621.1 cytochrome C biogenesis protein [Methanobrevibacter sp.]
MEVFPLISFLTGVISILSPCILPILPIFIGFNLKSRPKMEIVSFTLGLFSIFTLIIFLTAFFTAFVYKYIIYVRLASAIILLFIGISMLLDFSFDFIKISPRNDYGSFALGVLTSVAWVPCYSAYLISLISLLLTTADPIFISFNIILYCLGFGLTILVLSFALSKINIESLISRTNFIPKIFAILIIISALYLML